MALYGSSPLDVQRQKLKEAEAQLAKLRDALLQARRDSATAWDLRMPSLPVRGPPGVFEGVDGRQLTERQVTYALGRLERDVETTLRKATLRYVAQFALVEELTQELVDMASAGNVEVLR
jgi:hypothetical protein